MQRTVQWTGDNAAEIESMLSDHVARADKYGDRCVIIGINGMHVDLELGDSIVVDGDHLGVIRHKKGTPVADPEMIWDGNTQRMAAFLIDFELAIEVIGDDLYLRGTGERKPVVVKRADKLIKRHGNLIVSRAGKDH
jgi:hypothetical protein